MLQLYTVLILLQTVLSRTISPIIITRPLSRVEFSDLLSEYNQNYADDSNESVEIDVFLDIIHAEWIYNKLYMVLEIIQSWKDNRLKFSGDSTVTVPRGTELWMPDTYFVDSVKTSWQQESSIRLRYDGMLFKKQRASIYVACNETNLNSNQVSSKLFDS
ncbi:unnamed protein product [Dracunculus medinensis]|uniref:Neur_chan_LBD domain-containing protein n=1 Tax=Dracunculus medinensis TaxID=318479 RepID=A0A0N4URD3_DRAME|nr:unnamed protein product [Dracunculus medinensis]